MPSPPFSGPLFIPSATGGMLVEHDGRDNIEVSLDRVRRVGLASLADVLVHDIVQVAGLISHHVKLSNGGEVSFAFNQAGQLVTLSASKVRVSLNGQHDVLFHELI